MSRVAAEAADGSAPDERAAAPGSRRAQREARREQILEVATRLFGEGGYRGTSLRDLARACGVSHPTLLHYFPGKDELLMAVLRRRDERTAAVFEDVDDPRELPALVLRLAELNATAPGLVALFAVTSAEATAPEHPAHGYYRERYRAAVEGMSAQLERARAQGLLRAHVDPRRAARAMFALQDGAQVQWLLEPADADVTALLADLVRAVFVEDAWPAQLHRAAPITTGA
ncbi:TetR/AcrR family transcriptional regulator [Kineococcus auxinigenes]|uniref:TetR/AcrR family transcriptional regulator n=1 Tax=unclassified Kineococcus TaxID=2621656 RepID=UPI003D7EBC4F